MAPPRHPLRDRIIGRAWRGEFASIREIMVVASIPRQTASRWLREAGLNIERMRLARLAKMHEQEERYLAGRPARRKPSKRFLRKIAERALREFNARNTKPQQPGTTRETGGKPP